jgi:ornithine--oxo-acid transaminase
LTALEEEGLIEQAAARGERLIAGLRRRLSDCQFVHAVRGKGMMIAVEFGPPQSLKLKGAYALLEKANKGLYCQLILIPLFRTHRLLAQVAGHNMPVIKLLPPLVCSDDDILWIETAFEQVVRESESLGAIWEMGRTLAGHAMKARAKVA